MTKNEALRLAEEAILDELEAVTDEEFEDAAGKLDDALRAIKKALEEPTVRENLIVEPVAWKAGNVIELKKPQFENGWTPLYTTPQPRQDVDLTDALKYYADTYCEGWCKENGGTFEDCGGCKARAVLAKYKEKNK